MLGGVSPVPGWPPPESWAIPLASPAPPPSPVLPSPAPDLPPPPGHHPAGSPLPSQAHGFDASFPECGPARQPRAGAFALLGVNGGRAFSLNPCFLGQWLTAPSPRFIYLNSGYNPANAAKTTASCRALAKGRLPTAPLRTAYAIGCSTAVDTMRALAQVGAAPPLAWWIDVESANSWDVRAALNRASLEGEVDALATTHLAVGVYATFRDWAAIVGSWDYGGISADWVAGQSPARACSSPGFSLAPVWISQEPATWPGSGWDSDYAC
ncbi:MAG: hypothetical protein ACREPI_00185 [Candidatus Dormibacterales bacterium]